MLKIDNVEIVRGYETLKYDMSANIGEIVAIQGMSGIGKSTLLEAIAGFVTVSSGHIYWNEQEITKSPPDQRPVSMMFQENNLFEHLSVWENLKLAGDHLHRDSIENAAHILEVEKHLKKLPSSLSGGQRQRIALIRTLLRSEPLVLLDEPFSELDDATRKTAINWTRDQAREKSKTLLLVTHHMEDVTRLADRVIQIA